MSKKNKNIVTKQSPIINIGDMSLQELDSLHKSIPSIIDAKVEKGLSSDNITDVMSVNSFLKSRKSDSLKSIFFNPWSVGSGNEYKPQTGGVSFSTLQKMGDIYIIKAIINTRVEQVQNFLKFSEDEQVEGFTIRKKRGIFKEKENANLTTEEKKKISELVEFLENGGYNEKWDIHDSFQDFVRKITRDSLVLDQLAFEIVRDRSFEILRFKAVDASLIRLLDSVDPRFREEFEKCKYKGYYPRYGMVYDAQVVTNPISKEPVLYYPWELGYGVRNATTNIERNGYGVSELETLISIMTWILWGFEYNGNFFKQGSQPKGFINIKGSNIDNSTLNEFRQAWSQTMRGVSNAHRVPILQGLDMEWIDLQHSNRDMEFTEWVKFLMVITCAVYRIDPSELGFNFQDSSSVFGQDGQRERLQHSRSKGLKPLLIFIQNIINHYLISEIDDQYEFAFTGIDVEDEDHQVDLDGKKLQNGMVSMEDMFEKYSGRKFDPEKDTILNNAYLQAAQMKVYGGQGMNQTVEEETGEEGDVENPFEEESTQSFEETSQESENPILNKAFDYIQKSLGKKA